MDNVELPKGSIFEGKEHGMALYKKGCKCEICRGANAAYQRDYQARRKAKLQALKDFLGGSSDATT